MWMTLRKALSWRGFPADPTTAPFCLLKRNSRSAGLRVLLRFALIATAVLRDWIARVRPRRHCRRLFTDLFGQGKECPALLSQQPAPAGFPIRRPEGLQDRLKRPSRRFAPSRRGSTSGLRGCPLSSRSRRRAGAQARPGLRPKTKGEKTMATQPARSDRDCRKPDEPGSYPVL